MLARLTLGTSDLERANAIAAELTNSGFVVRRVRPAAISLEGGVALFQSMFDCEVEETEGEVRFQQEPKMPAQLGAPDATLYFPRAPEYFP